MHAWPFILAAALAGCATQSPRIVEIPAVCPAPREKPGAALAAVDALPTRLPLLADGLPPEEAADAIILNRRQSAAIYQRARELAAKLAEWIRNEGGRR